MAETVEATVDRSNLRTASSLVICDNGASQQTLFADELPPPLRCLLYCAVDFIIEQTCRSALFAS